MMTYIIQEKVLGFFQRYGKSLGVAFLMLMLWESSYGQACNYKSGTVTMSLSGQTTGSNVSSQLVLTNSSGVIQYVSPVNVMSIANVSANTYQAVAVTYTNSVSPNLTVGGDINLVSSCSKTVAVPISICDCNNATGVFTVGQTGKTNLPGQTNVYVLTDGKGRILSISNSPSFSNNGNGVYNVYGVSYTGTVSGLTVGGTINGVSGSCVDITNAVGYVVCVPELAIVKSGPSVAEKGTNYNYTLTVSNSGTTSTFGTTVVSDTLATGLSFVSGSGSGWSCSSSTLAGGRVLVSCTTTTGIAAGGSSSLNLTVVSSVTGTVVNKAWVSGGGDIVAKRPSNPVTTVINEPAKPNLVIAKAGPSSVTVGSNFDYTLTVSNNGTAGTSGLITVTDNLPTGIAFVGSSSAGSVWSCSASGQLVTCTSSASIIVNANSNIILTVQAVSAASSPAINTAYVSGGGDPSTTPKPSNPVTTTINPTPKPSISIVKSGPVTATVGTNYNYTLTVNNTGNAATSGTITVTDVLATNLQYVGFSGTGWSCSASNQTVTCMTSNVVAVNGSNVLTLTVKALDAASGSSVVNTASVIGGGDPSTTPKPSNPVTTDITPAPKPNLLISKSGPVTGIVNTNYDYTLVVNNSGTASTAGVITVTDNLPNGLQFVSGGGNGWSCSASGQLVTCTNSGVIAVSGSSSMSLTVKPTQAGTYTNVGSVVGGGDISTETSNSVTTVISNPPTPNLVVVKSGPSTATVGTNFNYTLTVNNTGLAASTGTITVTDNLPSELSYVTFSGSGWTCSAVGQAVTCTTTTSIAANGSSTIVLTVNPTTAPASGLPVKNTAYVTGGGDPVTTPKPSNEVPTTINALPQANLTITKSAPVVATVGTNFAYSFNIANGGTGATTGTITVTDNLPIGLQFVSGPSTGGFTCSAVGQVVTCTNNGSTQIPAGQSVGLSINVKANFSGVFKNTAVVSSNGGTPKTSNETTTTVNCPTDINPGVLGF